ncbi:MAG: UDP-N-acetylmuramoyl-L-alanyl-D-glutamate--2,6-diaminopimelate ligase [Rubrivivax sp.]|nr:UDP-N-acetylmuramoyl-L-alanyl-D-glutamate--2,6-diaminopimelate ligase [Rubrivivax sp.]
MQHLGSSTAAAAWLHARGVRALRTDHRQVRPGDAFLAWPGRRHDGRAHTASALAAGAAACLIEAQGLQAEGPGRAALAALTKKVPEAEGAGEGAGRMAALTDLKRQAGEVADTFLGHPSRALDVVAVTGTNGKTSTTWWVAQALGALGRGCGVVGTLGVRGPGTNLHDLEPAGLTTPDAVALQTAFRRFVDAGLSACAIEASSIGITEHRLAGTSLAVAAFTNLTQDHLDYHGTMVAYGAAKRALFDMPGLRAAVLNVDDAHGRAWAAELQDRRGPQALTVWCVSASALGEPAPGMAEPGAAASPRLWVRQVRHTTEGLEMMLCEREGAGATVGTTGSGTASVAVSGHAVCTPLIGGFNVENLLVVAGCLRALGIPLAEVARALATLTPVPGRLQRVAAVATVGDGPQPAVVVDYAHTPDALDKALQALAPLAQARGGQLWCVFGCGGDRDASKRPLMGQAAVRGAAHVVVTSDNPRSEDPAHILAQVMAGARQSQAAAATRSLQAIEDRRAAIVHAVRQAAPEDVVLIAGKGHEQTQEIAGVKHPFCDVAEATAALQARPAGASSQAVGAQP